MATTESVPEISASSPAEIKPQSNGLSRRTLLQAGAAAAGALGFPFIRDAKAATLELRWLGWEHYNVKELTAAFEQEHGVKVSAGFFDGNSEAYNKLRAGGTQDFDLVMADGFWPRLYAKQGLTQAVDYDKLANLANVFPEFQPPNYMLLEAEDGSAMIAAPNCWGGYGFTVNTDEVDAADQETVGLLFNEKYGGHLSTSARFEENIALAGILAAHSMGTMDGERPDGKPFNPYVLTDAELERCKELLIKQKGLLVTRWNDEDTLERLLRAGRGLGLARVVRDLPPDPLRRARRQDRPPHAPRPQADGGRARLGRHLGDHLGRR